jgi:hypothetical protein
VRTRAVVAALLLLGAAPASAQVRTFGDWIAACDNQRNCAAYSWNRDSYNAYLRIKRDGAPSADATATLAISRNTPVTFKVEAADLFPPTAVAGLLVEIDGHIRLSVEKPAAAIAAWVRKTKKLEVLQLDPPMSDPDDRKLDGIPLTGVLAALSWIDERQQRTGSETAFVKRGAKSVAALPPQPAQPVVTVAQAGDAPVPAQHPPEVLARANATCGKEQRDAEHVKTVRLAAGRRQAALRAAAAGCRLHQARRAQAADQQGCGVQSGIRRDDVDADLILRGARGKRLR